MGNAQFIPVILPNEAIGGGVSQGLALPFLGHAGFILVDASGNATWYEYGHYTPGASGVVTTNTTGGNSNVRSISLGTVPFDGSGNMTQAGMKTALDKLFGLSGLFPDDPGLVTATPFSLTPTQYTNISASKNTFLSDVNAGRKTYSLFGDPNCINFVYAMANAASVTISTTQTAGGFSVPSIAADNILQQAGSSYEYFSPYSWTASGTVQSSIQVVTNPINLSPSDYAVQFFRALATMGYTGVIQPALSIPSGWTNRSIQTLPGGVIQWQLGNPNGSKLIISFGGTQSPIDYQLLNSNGTEVTHLAYNTDGSNTLDYCDSAGHVIASVTDFTNGASRVRSYASLPTGASFVDTNYPGFNGTGKMTSMVYNFASGKTLTFNAGAFAGTPTYNASTNITSVNLTTTVGDVMGSLQFNASTGAASFVTAANEVFALPAINNNTITASAPGTSALQTLANDFAAMGATTNTTTAQLIQTHFNDTNATGTAHTLTGTATSNGNGTATVTFTADAPNATITKQTSVFINGSLLSVSNNVLNASSQDLARDTISAGFQTLNASGFTGLTATQFNGFSSITGSGTIVAESGGTFDLTKASVNQSAAFNLTANDWSGTTLIGNNVAGQKLTASATGNDTLTAGNGAGDTLYAGAGMDTLTGGTGGDAFAVAFGLASGSSITGHGTGNLLAIATSTASGGVFPSSLDVTGDSITGIQTLSLSGGGSLTLTGTQYTGFSSFLGDGSGAGTFVAATSGTYNLASKTTSYGFNLTAMSTAGGVTLIGNNIAGETLTASATGNDTLQLGTHGGRLAGGGGNDVFQLGAGTNLRGDTLAWSATGETFGFGSATTAIVQSGAQTIINGADGTLVANDGISGGPVQNLFNWGAGGSTLETVASAGSVVTDTGYAQANAGGSQLWQTALTTAGGSKSATASGTGATLALSSASIALAASTSATVSGTGNSITLAAGDTLGLSGALAGSNTTFSSGAETIAFAGGNTVTVAAGNRATITGTDGSMAVDNNADGVTANTVNWTAGGSQQQQFSGLSTGISEIENNWSGANLTGTDTDSIVDYTAGNSVDVVYAGLPSGELYEFRSYSGLHDTGTFAQKFIDWNAGGSQLQLYTGLGSGITLQSQDYTGVNGGTQTDTIYTYNIPIGPYPTGSSIKVKLTGLGTGVSSEIDYYSASNGTGLLYQISTNNTNGTSQIEFLNPGSGLPSTIASEFVEYSGVNDTGTNTQTTINWSAGGSQLQQFSGLQNGISELVTNYAGANGTGAINDEIVDYTGGTSTDVVVAGLPGGETTEFRYYSGLNDTGTLTQKMIDFSNGTSQLQQFAGLQTGISEIVTNYAGANGSGAVNDAIVDYTGGTSTDVVVTGLPSGETLEYRYYSGLNDTGTLTATTKVGSSGNDTLAATSPNQTLTGSGGYDTYTFGRGDGFDGIQNGLSTNAGATGELDIGAGVTTNQLWFEHVGNDLQVDILGTQDHMTVSGWYAGTTAQLQEIKTADGHMIDTQLQQLVQAMATFGANNSGFNPTTATQMPTDTSLQSALAAAWHT